MSLIKFFILILISSSLLAQESDYFQITRVKYGGGGDWYNDQSADINLMNYVEENTNIKTTAEYNYVEISSDDIFSHPFLFITGHGNIVLSESETERLRRYLQKGGFLYVDDDYGLDEAIRREMKKVLPGKDFVELPFNHGIYHSVYDFNNGPPKTHEHDGKPPQGFGIFIDGRLAVYYTYESNPSDGWADPQVHQDPEEVREKALKFGTNIVVWALSN
jgi:hypothetical protein